MKEPFHLIACVLLLWSIVLAACSSVLEATPTTEKPLEAGLTTPMSEPGATIAVLSDDDTSGEIIGTLVHFDLPTVAPYPTSVWRPPPYPAPWAIKLGDHYLLSRPIPSGEVNWPNPRYRYGSTLFGEENIHTGIDLGATRGAPVIAAGPGEVIWAGYGLYRGVYDETDPYGRAIVIRHDFGHQGQELFTVYAHMQSICAWEGQRVQTGEVIGTVGDTGHASGPHLHFEVRLGENSIWSTRNPELWIVPPEGWGVLAGRIQSTYGQLIPEYLVQIYSIETGQRWDVWSYVTGTIHADDFYDENFVISDLPAGPYEVHIDFVGHTFIAHLFLYPGQTNFLTFRGRNGFVIEPTPTPVDLSKPPDL